MKRIGLVGGLSAYHGKAFTALFNERDAEKWAELKAFTPKSPTVAGGQVTLVWDEDRAAAERLAGAAPGIEIVDRKEDMLGRIDGAIIVDDLTMEHARHSAPFLAAGVPTFIDKPLSRDANEAAALIAAAREGGAPMFSSSALRFARELAEARDQIAGLGRIQALYSSGPGELIFYGIHALEFAVAAVGPGIESVQNVGEAGHDIVKVRWRDGKLLVLQVVTGGQCPFLLRLFGETGTVALPAADGEAFYRNELEAFVRMIETGEPPFPASETLEIVQALQLAVESQQRGGEVLRLPGAAS